MRSPKCALLLGTRDGAAKGMPHGPMDGLAPGWDQHSPPGPRPPRPCWCGKIRHPRAPHAGTAFTAAGAAVQHQLSVSFWHTDASRTRTWQCKRGQQADHRARVPDMALLALGAGPGPAARRHRSGAARPARIDIAGGRDIDRPDLYTFFFIIILYICGRVRAEMGRRKWLRWPPWARTRRFGCPVAWHTHVVVWVCQNIVDYGVYTRLGKSRISEEIPENILNRATSPPSTAERQKPPRWTQKVVLGGERGRVGSPTNTPSD